MSNDMHADPQPQLASHVPTLEPGRKTRSTFRGAPGAATAGSRMPGSHRLCTTSADVSSRRTASPLGTISSLRIVMPRFG